MHKLIITVIAAATLASCTTTAPAPAPTSGKLEGYSCKRKAWSPSPTAEAAIADLKDNAAAKGYSDVINITTSNDPLAVMRNCWIGILARGGGVI